MLDSATFSACGRYRHLLTRELGGTSIASFVMLNPSTADAAVNDPTIRRCMGFASRWGFGKAWIVNLYAFRATDPADMRRASRAGVDVTGGDSNDLAIALAVGLSDLVVVAWGAHASFDRAEAVTARMVEAGRVPMCLGLTSSGEPRHPLMMRGDAALVPYARASRASA